MKTTIDLVDSDEDDDERQASDERYAHFGLELDERKEPHAHPSSSSQRSSTSLQLETDAQFAQALIFQDIAGFSSSSPPSTSSSSSFPSSTPPRWVSSHPNDPSNNPALRADLIAQHHEQLNSPEPHVNVHDLFLLYSQLFFFNQLQAVNVRWSKRMTTCAGLCRFDTRSGGCDIAMSEPLLKYRQKKEVMETLLHEMVHAFLFVGDHNMKDHDDHGPHFCSQMAMINATLGLNITVYHSFIDEVRHFKVHVWQCQGKCAQWKPYMGKVSRATNRKPGPADKWWAQHAANCGGTFLKVAGPTEEEMKAARKLKAKQRRAAKKEEKARDGERKEKSANKKEKGAQQTDLHGNVVTNKKPKRKRKGKGHVLGGGADEPKEKKQRVRKKKKVNEEEGDGALPAPPASPSPAAPPVPANVRRPPSSPAKAATSSSSSSSSSTSSLAVPSSSAAPTMAALPRSTNIFALMQGRGEGDKVAKLLAKAQDTSSPPSK